MIYQKKVKGFFGIGISLTLIIVLLPCFIVLSILIKRISTGSIFYHWKVAEKWNPLFTSYKFRTTYNTADARKKSYGMKMR